MSDSVTTAKARSASPLPAGAPAAPEGRLLWLDLMRFLCAIMIVSFHWLRACHNVGLFGGRDAVNLVVGYQGQTLGFGMFPYVLIAGTAASPAVWLSNIIGIIGGFGWEGVSALVLVSGFSLTLAMKQKSLSAAQWVTWLRKRAVRILEPFYLVALPMLVAYVALLAVFARIHGAFAAGIERKLVSLFPPPAFGVILSHTLLFNPFQRQWQASFFAPAWWFVPSILLAYLIYPFVLGAVRRANAALVLLAAATVTMIAYALADLGILLNESWYFIVLQEAFNFTLGVVVGHAWLSPAKRAALERVMFGRWTFPIALAVFVAGNVANWAPVPRLFASMLFGPGLVLAIVPIAKRIEHLRISRILTKIDAYDLYLVHEPFAFPVALGLSFLLRNYTIFAGWFVFVAIASLAALVLSFVQRLIAKRRRGTGSRGVAGVAAET